MDCGKDNNCSGNGKCHEDTKCLCNPGYFGIHCEKKNCDTLPKGQCSWSNISGLVNHCNKVSAPEGCSITPKLVGKPFSPEPHSGVIDQKCECVINGSPRGTVEIMSTDCACKLPKNHTLYDTSDGSPGHEYWHENKKHGGDHSNWDAICRQNYGPGSYTPRSGPEAGHYKDCGTHDECGHSMWYASSVPCVAPAGSTHNIPWAFYQTYN